MNGESLKMLHHDRDEFARILERTSAQTGFPLRLLEKDYYISLILPRTNSELSNKLIFKGGTCLSKVYFSYYRLSEDLDFSLKLPQDTATRSVRRKAVKPIKESIQGFAESLDMRVDNTDKAGRNESKQYVYSLSYDSIVLSGKASVKLEISLRANPILSVEEHAVKHKFVHPFTGEPLFDSGRIRCLGLKELVAEKMRAAATRRTIAPRDFYDLGCLLRKGFDFNEKEFLELFRKKLAEDNFTTDLRVYRRNLSRTEEEIASMGSRIQDELPPVLSISEGTTFVLQNMLDEFNAILKNAE